MIQTFQAFLVVLVAVLPGAVYTIARESRGPQAWRSPLAIEQSLNRREWASS